MTLSPRITPALLATAVALAAVRPTRAQTNPRDTADVRTAATAERTVRPDRAALSLQFSAEDTTPSGAGARVAMRADSVRRALAALGIPRDSVISGSRWSWWSGRVESFTRQRCLFLPNLRGGCMIAMDSIYRDGRLAETRPAIDTLYRAREFLEVRIADPTRVGAVIDVALALRIIGVSDIRFFASDTRVARLAALQEATISAREQAEAIASAQGGRLGRALQLSTWSEIGEYRYAAQAMSIVESSESRTVVTAPSVPVRMTVYGRWQLLER